jgi:dTDP-4-amino-4,6-dideoxygalactose transaminase
MNVPLLDLREQYRAIRDEIDDAIRDVMESQHFILGSRVDDCEAAIAAYCGARYAVGVSSGTDALLMCLMAEGIGPGDEVITTPYTFFATVGCITRLGATPVFVDIDPRTYNLCPAQIIAKLTPRTRAIVPVHLFGQSVEMTPVMAIAEAHGLVVIEDAAQAIGAMDRGHRVGSIGHYGCLSFYPSKNLSAAGDGGMILTNNGARAERLRCLRAHGSRPKYHHRLVGGNFRLDALQAAVVSVKLRHLDGWTARRITNAQRYDRLFRASSPLSVVDTAAWTAARPRRPHVGDEAHHVVLPTVPCDGHVFNQYVVRVARRDLVKSALGARGVETEIYYPVPMHLQECFAPLGYGTGDFPESEFAASETLALPIYPELTDDQAAYVVRSITDCLAAR